ILKNRMGCPPALQGRGPSDLNWYRTSTLGHRGHLDSLARRQLSRDPLGRPTVGGSRDRLDSRGSRDNLDLLPRRREPGPGPDHQRVSSSRENLAGSRDRLDYTLHAGSAHASREDLSGGGEGYPGGSRSQLNTLTRRQAASREHLAAGALVSSRYPGPLNRPPSSEHLDILSSILASFSSNVLTPPPGANGSAHGPSPSPPRSLTSQSISEVSPDSE
ncbi:unnamed protein product, partial [Merluccius merluccius]